MYMVGIRKRDLDNRFLSFPGLNEAGVVKVRRRVA